MATVKKRDGKPDRTAAAETKAVKSKPARRRRWLPLFGLAAIASLVWFAPAIVARTTLRQQIVPVLLPDFEGTCDVGTAALDWRSPIRLGNIVVRDKQGEQFLTAATLTSEKTLFEVVAAVQLGRFRVEQPQLRVILRDDGSNIEDALLPLLAGKDESATRSGYTIDVAGGTAEIIDKQTDRRLQMTGVAASFEIPTARTAPLKLQLSAALGEAPAAEPERLKIAFSWKESAGTTASPAGDGTLEFDSHSLQLDALRSLWKRLGVADDVSGNLSSNVKAEWGSDDNGGFWSSSGNAALEQLVVDAPDYFDGEQLKLASLSAGGLVACRGSRIGMNDVTLRSDVGSVTVSGTLDAQEFSTGETATELQSALAEEDYHLNGELDLAKLAALLPKTLRIRTGTKINSGKLTLALASDLEQDVRRWTGRLEATDISAEDAGRRIAWEQPIEITLAAHRSDDGPVIDELKAKSDFLQASASGTLQESQLTAHCDLERLASELGRFVDLDDLRLAGKIEASFRCQLGEDNHARATGRLTADGFQWHGPGGRPWEEQRLVATLAGTGIVEQKKLKQIEEAKLSLVSGADQLDVEQLQPIELTGTPKVPLRLNLKGGLASWLSRLRPWLSSDNRDVSGNVDLNTDVSLSAEEIRLDGTEINLQTLHVHGEGLFIDEPSVAIEASGKWNRAKRHFSSETVTLAGNTVSARIVNASVQLRDAGPPELSGVAAISANVDRLIRITQDPRTPARQRAIGLAKGNFKFSHAEKISQAVWNVDMETLTVALPATPTVAGGPGRQPAVFTDGGKQWQTVFQDGPLSLTGRGTYDHQRDTLKVSDVQLTSNSLKLRTAGTVDELTASRRVDLSGEVDYDAKQVAGLFRSTLGEDFKMTGRQTRAFSLKGPLAAAKIAATDTEAAGHGWPQELSGQAGFGWASAQLLGMAIGAGELDAQLKTAVLTVKPIDVTVGEGRLRTSPRILLDRTPMLLVLDKGPMIEKVRFSPEQCQSWLRYVAPVMADATQVEGRFSVDLDGGNVPLPDPKTGDVAGTLKIHSAEVRSGPMVDQLVLLARQIEVILRKRAAGTGADRTTSLLTMTEQAVPFRMVKGRVHHQGLAFSSGDVAIRTSGSVGFDESLSLVAEVPIPEKWIGGDRLLAGLKGHVLKVPIGGTLGRPQIDGRVLAELGRQIAGAAANRWLGNELDKQLNKLFQPKK